jgi:hypothetical protein
MPVKSLRETLKEGVKKRTEEAYHRKDESGSFGTIFRNDVEGVLYWKCTNAEHLIDIIPYIRGANDPDKKTKEGDPQHILELWVHSNVGVNQDRYVCPAKNFGKPCPICEYREQLKQEEEYDEELVKKLYPSRRNVFNIVVYDNEKEQAKGVQVWEVAHFFMGGPLGALSKVPRRGKTGYDTYIYYADPDNGKMISFEKKGKGKGNTEFTGLKFVDRDEPIPDEYLQAAKCLDDLIVIPTYDELSEAFYGSEHGSAEEAAETTADEEAPPEEEKEPETPPTRTKPRTQPAKEEIEEEPEKPVEKPKVRRPAGETECPGGGTFGESFETLKACANCAIWDDCSSKHDELEVAKKKSSPRAPAKPAPKEEKKEPEKLAPRKPILPIKRK